MIKSRTSPLRPVKTGLKRWGTSKGLLHDTRIIFNLSRLSSRLTHHQGHTRLFEGHRLSKATCIITEGHDAGIRDLLREKVSQPELLGLRVSPGGEGIAAEAMDGYDTVEGLRQRTVPKQS